MRHLSALLCAALLCAAATLASPALAYEPGCGGVHVVKPKKKVSPDAAPLVIGDSVLLGAMPQLAGAGFEVNARGCRGWDEGHALVERRERAHHLPHLVAVQLGTNYSISMTQIRRTLITIGKRRVLALFTPREVGGQGGGDAANVRAAAKRWPKQVVLLDWVRYTAGHDGWFQPDGIHLMPGGARALARLGSQALPYAAWGESPQPPAATTAAALPRLSASVLPSGARGAVGLRITGAAGAHVTVAEGGEILAQTTLTDRPSELRDIALWDCAKRTRTFTIDDDGGGAATATAHTPSCKGRLSLRAPRTQKAGTRLRVQAVHTWKTGPALPIEVCATPPAAPRRCASSTVKAGERRLLTWTASRPGRTTIAVRAAGRSYRRSVTITPRHGRLHVLAAGDSEMQELDAMIRSGLGSRARLHSDARISTGLTNTFFFDWVAHARGQGASLRPDVTVMFIGANDGFPLPVGGRQLACCSRAWSTALSARVLSMVRSYARSGTGVVYWFLLPLPRSPDLRRMFVAINNGYRIAAKANPGDIRLVDATGRFTPHGYRDSMSAGGRTITIHQSDGYHLSYPAMRIAAQMVLAQMRQDHVI